MTANRQSWYGNLFILSSRYGHFRFSLVPVSHQGICNHHNKLGAYWVPAHHDILHNQMTARLSKLVHTWAAHQIDCHCPVSRTYLIATRFWVVVICPIIKCLTVLEFSFLVFDLCLFITIYNFILNYVPIVTFWIFTYHKIWILLIIFCFIWNYWIIYFLTCLEVFLECCELTGVSLLWPWLIKWK